MRRSIEQNEDTALAQTLNDLGESVLLALVKEVFESKETGGGIANALAEVAIGDDAAVLRGRQNFAGRPTLCSDLLVEGQHFRRKWVNWYGLGQKAVGSTVSDLSAMGAMPNALLFSCALPGALKVEAFRQVLLGARAQAEKSQTKIVGGDLAQHDRVVLDVSALGYCDQPVLRHRAKTGELIYVSGALGGAAKGLWSLESDRNASILSNHELLARERFWQPPFRGGLAQYISSFATSMTDISDGLGPSLGLLVDAEQGLGTQIELERIPKHGSLVSDSEEDIGFALNGAEDYELLFTVPEEARMTLDSSEFGSDLSCIGQVTDSGGHYYVDAAAQEKRRFNRSIKGYQHWSGKK